MLAECARPQPRSSPSPAAEQPPAPGGVGTEDGGHRAPAPAPCEALEPRALLGECLLRAAQGLCRWPSRAPIRLAGLGRGAPVATLLGGFSFGPQTCLVACACAACARKPALAGDDLAEGETCVMGLAAFALHASGAALDLLGRQLYGRGGAAPGGGEAEAEAAAASQLLRLLLDVLYVLDVPYEGEAAAVQDAPAVDAGACRSPRGAAGVLPLSAFLRQAGEAAGGASLVGRRAWVHVFFAAAAARLEAAVCTSGGWAGCDRGRCGTTSSGSSSSWFSCRLVSYDPDTGCHRVQYDPGQPLELWQDPEGEYGTLHLATCHIHLGDEPPQGGRQQQQQQQQQPGRVPQHMTQAVKQQHGQQQQPPRLGSAGCAAAGARAAAEAEAEAEGEAGAADGGQSFSPAAAERRGLRGPFRGCLQEVPQQPGPLWLPPGSRLHVVAHHRAARLAPAPATGPPGGARSGETCTTAARHLYDDDLLAPPNPGADGSRTATPRQQQPLQQQQQQQQQQPACSEAPLDGGGARSQWGAAAAAVSGGELQPEGGRPRSCGGQSEVRGGTREEQALGGQRRLGEQRHQEQLVGRQERQERGQQHGAENPEGEGWQEPRAGTGLQDAGGAQLEAQQGREQGRPQMAGGRLGEAGPAPTCGAADGWDSGPPSGGEQEAGRGGRQPGEDGGRRQGRVAAGGPALYPPLPGPGACGEPAVSAQGGAATHAAPGVAAGGATGAAGDSRPGSPRLVWTGLDNALACSRATTTADALAIADAAAADALARSRAAATADALAVGDATAADALARSRAAAAADALAIADAAAADALARSHAAADADALAIADAAAADALATATATTATAAATAADAAAADALATATATTATATTATAAATAADEVPAAPEAGTGPGHAGRGASAAGPPALGAGSGGDGAEGPAALVEASEGPVRSLEPPADAALVAVGQVEATLSTATTEAEAGGAGPPWAVPGAPAQAQAAAEVEAPAGTQTALEAEAEALAGASAEAEAAAEADAEAEADAQAQEVGYALLRDVQASLEAFLRRMAVPAGELVAQLTAAVFLDAAQAEAMLCRLAEEEDPARLLAWLEAHAAEEAAGLAA